VGETFLPENVRTKDNNKIPEFYMIFVQKNIFPKLFFGGGVADAGTAPIVVVVVVVLVVVVVVVVVVVTFFIGFSCVLKRVFV